MRVKRFVGENVAETMGKVKRDLGSDAVILQTRQFREGGIFGFFGKVKVEITAAIEDSPAVKKGSPQNEKAQNPSEVQSIPASKLTNQSILTQDYQEDKREVVNLNPQNNYVGKDKSTLENVGLEREIQSMRLLLEKMNRQMDGIQVEKGVWPEPLQVWANILTQKGLTEPLVTRLIKQIQLNVREELWKDDKRVIGHLKESIARICSNTAPIQPGVNKPRVVALIGPTGVGKTTTIGKLAAGFSIVDKRKVALITADTYRVAAVEQLKTFGGIIGVPVEVVTNPTELQNAILAHSNKEIIFIDTAGRSPHHDLHMEELQAFIDKAQPDITMLVMSATTHLSDQKKVYERFKNLTTHLLFTKLDETLNSGSMLNILDETKLPVAYITFGQNVPDDIEVATPESITRYILGERSQYA